MGISRKRHIIEKSGVVGHADVPGLSRGRRPEERRYMELKVNAFLLVRNAFTREKSSERRSPRSRLAT